MDAAGESQDGSSSRNRVVATAGGSPRTSARRDAMLQTAVASRLDAYLAKKAEYERRRRKIRVDFDALYSMFAADMSSARIARKAGVSRPRIDHIYEQYFRDLFGMTGLERRQRREEELREHGVRRLAKAFAKDRVLRASRPTAPSAGARSSRSSASAGATRPSGSATRRCGSTAATWSRCTTSATRRSVHQAGRPTA